MKRTILSASIQLICQFWNRPDIIEDPRIGQQIRDAQAVRKAMEGDSV